MNTIIDRAASRGYVNYGWFEASHTFHFSNYYNPDRNQFGALYALNDCVIAPKKGFDMHPHQNAELVSIPLKGYLHHCDNLKNSDVITHGQIQITSSGTGLYHSEYNDSAREPLEVLQVWVLPIEEDTKPQYNNYDITPFQHKNQITPFLAPDTEISILQDAWFSWCDFDKHTHQQYTLKGIHTGVYVFVIEGKLQIEDVILERRDGMAISETTGLELTAIEDSVFLILEVRL